VLGSISGPITPLATSEISNLPGWTVLILSSRASSQRLKKWHSHLSERDCQRNKNFSFSGIKRKRMSLYTG
jgi:hypothetical protein